MRLALALAALALALFLLARFGDPDSPAPAGASASDAAPGAPAATLVDAATARESRASLPAASAAPPPAAAIARPATPKRERAGEIRIHVRDRSGRPVAARVVLASTSSRNPPVAVVDVDAGGRAVLSGLPPAKFTPVVEPDSLPAGHAPPWTQEARELYPNYPAIAPQYETPGPGEELVVELEVFRRATVFGHVYGPAGEPVEGVVVTLEARRHESTRYRPYAYTDRDGRFEMRSVMPAQYRTQISTKADHPYAFVRRPLFTSLDLEPGDAIELTLRLGGHGDDGVVAGRVVDELGDPVPGITVWCTYAAKPEEIGPGETLPGINDLIASTVTDESGDWRLEELPRRRMWITIGAGNFDFGDPWDGELEELPRPLHVDLSEAASPLTIPTTVAKRNTGYRVVGTVELDSAWAAAHGVASASAIRVSLEVPGERSEPLRLWRGQFRWGAMQPPESATVVLHEKRTGANKTLQLEPRPSVHENLLITFP